MYHSAAPVVPGSSASVITRKYDVSDIASHARRNVSTLSARVTTLIASRNRFSMNPENAFEELLSLPVFAYPTL